MKILWFPRLQYDVDRLHLVTWKEMAKALEQQGHAVRVAVAGIPKRETPPGWIRSRPCATNDRRRCENTLFPAANRLT